MIQAKQLKYCTIEFTPKMGVGVKIGNDVNIYSIDTLLKTDSMYRIKMVHGDKEIELTFTRLV